MCKQEALDHESWISTVRAMGADPSNVTYDDELPPETYQACKIKYPEK